MRINPGYLLVWAFFCLCLIAAPILSAGTIDGIEGAAGIDFVADQFVISVDKGVTIAPWNQANPTSTGYAGLDLLFAREHVTMIEKFYSAPVKNEMLRDVLNRLYLVTIGPEGDLASAMAAFNADPLVEFAEPNYIHHFDYVPNDPLIGGWYQLSKIQAYLAWDFIRGDSTSRPILGIVDSGVYYDHPDLEPVMWINSFEDIDGDGRFTSADIDGIDDDANGYTDDVVGWDIGMNDNIPFEPTPWHGTHVAGCATMATDNGTGGAATAWGARIMAVKAARDNDPNSIYNGYPGIAYAVDNGATVVNLSWGRAGNPSQYEQRIITVADSMGCVVVAAAGNETSSYPHYPAGYLHVLCVASVGPTDHLSGFSNYGTWIDICAPGEGVFSTWGHNSYSSLDGTSMASPVAAGAVCLLRAANPTLTVDEIVQKLKANADTIDHLNPSRRGMLGAGRVNIAAAIGRETFPLFALDDSRVTQTEDDGDGRLNPGERFSLAAFISNQWADAVSITGYLSGDGQFTIVDSVANFGNIPGRGGSGDNAGNPFDIRVNPDALTGSHQFTLRLVVTNFQTELTLSVNITLEQAGFPGNIPGNIDGPVLVHDIDNDGQKEIVVSAANRNYYVFNHDGSISAGWPKAVSHEAPGGAAVGDINHDGHLDVVGMSRDGNIYAWTAGGDSLPGFPRNCGTLTFGTPIIGDIDGDSTLEIVIGSFSTRSVYVLNHDGTDSPNWPFVGSGNFYGSAALADIDNDGLPEILYGDFDSTLHVWNADKTYVPGFPVRLSGQIRTNPCVADIDGDGNLNIVIGTSSGDIYILGHNGAVMPGWPVRTGGPAYSPPSLADIDLDGRLEILAGANDGNLYAYGDNGQPQPGFPILTGGTITASPVVGDVDSDTWPDVVFGSYDGKIYAVNHLGQPLRNFPINGITPGQIAGSAALADLDGDGDCEVIVGIRAAGNNLEVIDYKIPLTTGSFPWPMFGKNIARTSYYGYFETGVRDDVSVPGLFNLGQNYPNPFNSNTIIRFSIPAAGNAELAVYDLLGRRVRTLFSGTLLAGIHEIAWDGSCDNGQVASSGVYFYRLASSNAVSTNRMTLLK